MPPATRFSRALSNWEEQMDSLTKRHTPDRSEINTSENYEVFYWSKTLGVTKQKLLATVAKVGNLAKAVRKELGIEG